MQFRELSEEGVFWLVVSSFSPIWHPDTTELDPRYCDVILARWEALTGDKAQLDGSGEVTGRMSV